MAYMSRALRHEAYCGTSEPGSVAGNARAERFHRIAALSPGFETALQWTYARNALALEGERRTGARGFVGSGAVQDDLAVA